MNDSNAVWHCQARYIRTWLFVASKVQLVFDSIHVACDRKTRRDFAVWQIFERGRAELHLEYMYNARERLWSAFWGISLDVKLIFVFSMKKIFSWWNIHWNSLKTFTFPWYIFTFHSRRSSNRLSESLKSEKAKIYIKKCFSLITKYKVKQEILRERKKKRKVFHLSSHFLKNQRTHTCLRPLPRRSTLLQLYTSRESFKMWKGNLENSQSSWWSLSQGKLFSFS